MKNQYFGDVNDYRKYGLLRAWARTIGGSILVAWMLTPDDSSSDGVFTRYLLDGSAMRSFDPGLHDFLRRQLVEVGQPRSIRLIEQAGMLAGAAFFPDAVPDGKEDRLDWMTRLQAASQGKNLVFLDPDNGIEVASKPKGRKNSSKYVFWDEIRNVYEGAGAVLVYQHFRRESRESFISRMMRSLREELPGSQVSAFRTSHVLFLLAARPNVDVGVFEAEVEKSWPDQIYPVRT